MSDSKSSKVAVMEINGENVPTLLGNAYTSSMSATVRYRSLDSYLKSRNTRLNQIYPAMVKQYQLNGIEVKPNSPEERQISLYQQHVDRFFKGSWDKAKVQTSFKNGEKVKTRKGADKSGDDKPITLSDARAEKLVSSEDCMAVLAKAMKKAGLIIVKSR